METRKELNTLADQRCWTIFVNHVTPFTRICGYLVKTRAKSRKYEVSSLKRNLLWVQITRSMASRKDCTKFST
jgi:hypothetical protein